MKTNPNEPINIDGKGFWNDEMNKTHGGVGLTKREYFAGLAMQGLSAWGNENVVVPLKDIAELSVKYADTLIEELNKGQK
jgi:hypothetical protein